MIDRVEISFVDGQAERAAEAVNRELRKVAGARARMIGSRAAACVATAVEHLRIANAKSEVPWGKGRSAALLDAAREHGFAADKLDAAAKMVRRLWDPDGDRSPSGPGAP